MASDLHVSTIGELWPIPLKKFETLYGDQQGQLVWKLCRGIDEETVKDRKNAKSVSCGKTFYGPHRNLKTMEIVQYWLNQLASELTERLQGDCILNDRLPELLTVSRHHYLRQASPFMFLSSLALLLLFLLLLLLSEM